MKRALIYLRNGVLAVLALIALLLAYAWISEWLKEREREKVQLLVTLNDQRCKGTEFPLWITILNGSSKKILEVSMKLSAREPGYSTDLVYGSSYTSDRIILPNEGWSVCYRFPELRSGADGTKLEWSVKRNWISFEE
jgi:hypothetical protein